MWDEILKEYHDIGLDIANSSSDIIENIRWEKYKKQKNKGSFQINILSAFDKEPKLNDVYLGFCIYDNIRNDYYISNYIWIYKMIQGWTYKEMTTQGILDCRKGQHYSLYPDINKPIQYYKNWSNLKKRLIKDYGTNVSVIPIIQQEFFDPWNVKGVNKLKSTGRFE